MKSFNLNKVAAQLAVAGLMVASTVAQAAPQAAIDVTDVTAGLTNQVASITAVAAGVLGLHILLKAYKWIRRALS